MVRTWLTTLPPSALVAPSDEKSKVQFQLLVETKSATVGYHQTPHGSERNEHPKIFKARL